MGYGIWDMEQEQESYDRVDACARTKYSTSSVYSIDSTAVPAPTTATPKRNKSIRKQKRN